MTKAKVQSLKLVKGDYVVLPSHGVGVLSDIETQQILGEAISLYKIHFEAESMDVFVPFAKFEESGLRKIASKEMANEVFDIISKAPRNQRGIWNKRMQEYDAKVYSGVLRLSAEVVRDGFICAIDANRSYTERSRYKLALQRVCSEVGIVLNMTTEEVENKIVSILRSVQDKSNDELDEFNSTIEEDAALDEIYNKVINNKS